MVTTHRLNGVSITSLLFSLVILMIKYPKVEHKIPELFQLIIKNDYLGDLLKQFKVVSFNRFKQYKSRRIELERAAEKFIQRQKGGILS